METTRITTFTIEVDDKPGIFATFLRRLKEGEVDMVAFWGYPMGFGKAQFIAVPADKAAFQKTAQKSGWTAKEGFCFRLATPDKHGVFCETFDKIAAAGLNLHAVEIVGVNGQVHAYLWTEEKDLERLGKALKA